MRRALLARAARLARWGGYHKAIALLNRYQETEDFDDDFDFNYLLGVAYLHAGIYGMALTCMKRARDLRLTEPRALLGLAVLHLKRGYTGRAVDLYLEVQDLDPLNRVARRALAVIRDHPGPENMARWIDAGRLHTLFPPFPRPPRSPVRTAAAVLLTAAALGAAGAGLLRAGLVRLPWLDALGIHLGPTTRLGAAALALAPEDEAAPMGATGEARYTLTRDQVLDTYREAQRLFTAYRDEAARVLLNRILESNGPEAVKTKARLLASYLDEPGFDTLDERDRFGYAQVLQDPALYRGCHVIWRGVATNIELSENRTVFDLLVGYDTRRVMEGIARVDCPFAVAISPELPLEILGRIVPVSTERGADIRLDGLAVNQTGAALPANRASGR